MFRDIHKVIIKSLSEATKIDTVEWKRGSSPTSFLWENGELGILIDSYKTKADNLITVCFELAILKNKSVDEDIVVCDAEGMKDDYGLLRDFYQLVQSKFYENNDNEITKIISKIS